MKTIFFVTYGGGHVNRIVPLIHELQQNRKYNLQILGLTTAGTVLERENIPYMGFRDLGESSTQRVVDRGRELSKNIQSDLVSKGETIAYLGMNYIDLETRLGPDHTAKLYAQKGRSCFLPLLIMKQLFHKVKPDLVFATNSPRSERAAIITAGEMGIPSICHLSMFCSRELEWIGVPGFASKICLSSGYLQKNLLSMGRSPEEIIVTGNPAFDRLADEHLDNQGNAFRKKHGWGNSLVILWASQVEPDRHPFTGKPGDPDLPRKVEKTLFKLLSLHPNWRLVIRPHPSEKVEHSNLPEQVEISNYNEEHAILIKAVDVVLTMTSTVGQEAFLLGKPLVTLNLSVFKDDVPYMESGMSRGVNRLEELEDALQDVLERGWTPEAQTLPVGQATQNVIDVIEDTFAGHSL